MKYLLASLIAAGLIGGIVTANVEIMTSKHKYGPSNLRALTCNPNLYTPCPQGCYFYEQHSYYFDARKGICYMSEEDSDYNACSSKDDVDECKEYVCQCG